MKWSHTGGSIGLHHDKLLLGPHRHVSSSPTGQSELRGHPATLAASERPPAAARGSRGGDSRAAGAGGLLPAGVSQPGGDSRSLAGTASPVPPAHYPPARQASPSLSCTLMLCGVPSVQVPVPVPSLPSPTQLPSPASRRVPSSATASA